MILHKKKKKSNDVAGYMIQFSLNFQNKMYIMADIVFVL